MRRPPNVGRVNGRMPTFLVYAFNFHQKTLQHPGRQLGNRSCAKAIFMDKGQMIDAVIVDDNQVACAELRKRLENQFSDCIKVVGVAVTASDGANLLRQLHPQLLFLDVELPDVRGLDLLSEPFTQHLADTKVVVYTAHQRYLLDSLRFKAFDFLQKPIDDNDFEIVMRRVLSDEVQTEAPNEIAENNSQLSEYLILDTLRPAPCVDDICYFRYERFQRRWKAHVLSQELKLKTTVKAEDLLALGGNFIQISRSYIINMTYLQEISKTGQCKFFPPFDAVEGVCASRRYIEKIREKM